MNIKFILNEYILIWNLLFRQSISKELNSRKQKIWLNYKKEYNDLYGENKKILKDPKNYIPDDDTIYNIIKEQDVYESIYKYTDKYRLSLIAVWNEQKKNLVKEIKSILKMNLEQYSVYLVDPRLNITDSDRSEETENKAICYGMKKTNKKELLIDLIYKIVLKELYDYNKEYQDITEAVLELCILNELATRIIGKSYYLKGKGSLNFLKKQIYPYFLMYLGVKQEDMINFMRRDGILFDIKNYPYQEELKEMELYDFIDFCIKKQQYTIKIEEIEVI